MQKIKKLFPLITTKKLTLLLIIIALIGLYFCYIHPYASFENFKKNIEIIEKFVALHYYSALLIYCSTYIIVVALSLPVALLMSLIGGFLFGSFFGAFLVTLSATLGATVAFLIVRYVAGNYFQNRYKKELITFNREIAHYGIFYLILVHFFPFIPFFVINILSALTKISVLTFIITTALGIAPITLLYTTIGHQLAMIETYPTYIVKILVLLTFIALLLLGIFIIVRKIKAKKDEKK